MQNAESVHTGPHSFIHGSSIRILACTILFAFAGILECSKLASLNDPEIWRHLGIGAWILQNRSLPQSGILSQVHSQPWRDYSWGFDVAVALGYKMLGLRIVPALLILFRFALAVIAFQVAGGWRNFWPAAGISAIVQVILLSMQPDPVFASGLLFGTVLLILFQARRLESIRLLLLLPAIFLLWANLDTGFVYGIFLCLWYLVALALEAWARSLGSHWFEGVDSHPPFKAIFWSAAGCVLVVFLNPSTYHPFLAFFMNEFSPVNADLPGYASMRFRQPQDYLLMLLAMAAFLTLGLLRSRDLFQLGALTASAALAFHAQREGWLLALVSIAVLGDAQLRSQNLVVRSRSLIGARVQFAAVSAALAVLLMVFLAQVPGRREVLLQKIANTFPVHAAEYLRSHPQPQPLFNAYRWGGFLMWYLPEYPVAIDSRRNLYPDETVMGYFKMMDAEIPYREFPPMAQARTLLMEKGSAMGDALRGVAGFRVIYEDDLSILYSHEAVD